MVRSSLFSASPNSAMAASSSVSLLARMKSGSENMAIIGRMVFSIMSRIISP
jgi:hypothetical protein